MSRAVSQQSSGSSGCRAVVALGASAGGVPILAGVLEGLPADLPAAVFIVQHVSPHSKSRLDVVLQRHSKLRVVAPMDGEEIREGTVYVAHSDRHLMVGDRVRVTRGPKECRARPSIDVLFRSAAVAFGPRAIGVVLTGMLDDGTAGLWAIKDRGGIALVQAPFSAEYPSMPESALQHVAADAVLPASELAAEIARRCRRMNEFKGHRPPSQGSDRLALESRIAAEDNALEAGVLGLGTASTYTCPECQGVLMQIDEGANVRFRCHTGHAFSTRTLLADLDASIDQSLWSTLRAIEERIMLLQQMGSVALAVGDADEGRDVDARVEDAKSQVAALRKLLLGRA